MALIASVVLVMVTVAMATEDRPDLENVTLTTTTTSSGTTTTTPVAVSTVVTLTGLDFDKLNPTLKATLVTNIKNAFLASMTGYTAADLTVVLTKGSVKATVTVTPKAGSTTAALTTSLTSQSSTIVGAVLTNVKAMPAVSSILETGMTVTDLAASATAPTSGSSGNHKGTTSAAESVGMIPVALMAVVIATLFAIKP